MKNQPSLKRAKTQKGSGLKTSKGQSTLVKFFQPSKSLPSKAKSFEDEEQALFGEKGLPQLGSSPQPSPPEEEPTKRGVTFPLLLKVQVVAKFLCSFGQHERLLDFRKDHLVFLEREPRNLYDRRAIRVGAIQNEGDLKMEGQQLVSQEYQRDLRLFNREATDLEIKGAGIKLYLGYVPKDVAFNLSVLLDHPEIFEHRVVEYWLEDRGKSYITVLVWLKETILRDHRRQVPISSLVSALQQVPGTVFFADDEEEDLKERRKEALDLVQRIPSFALPYVPGMPKFVKQAMFKIAEKSLHRPSLPSPEDSQPTETKTDEANATPSTEADKSDEIENKFNRNFSLILKTISGYDHLFYREKELGAVLDGFVKRLSAPAQVLLAKLYLRKRTWFNGAVHLMQYKQMFSLDEKAAEAILEKGLEQLRDEGFIQTDNDLLVDFLVAEVKRKKDEESPVLSAETLSTLAGYLEGFTMVKLDLIFKVVCQKVKNISLSRSLPEGIQLSPGLNPFHRLEEFVGSYNDKHISRKYGDLLARLSLNFGFWMEEHMDKNRRRYKSAMSKRELVEKILIRIQALMAACIRTPEKTEPEEQANQPSLLSFFHFSTAENLKHANSQSKAAAGQAESDLLIDEKKLANTEQKLKEIVAAIREIDSQVTFGEAAKSEVLSMTFRIRPEVMSVLSRSMDLFFFYQSGIENFLSNHDFGFYQYEKFRNYLDFQKGETNELYETEEDLTAILKPVFESRQVFLKFDCLDKLNDTLFSIEAMKLKDPSIGGKIAADLVFSLVFQKLQQTGELAVFDMTNDSQVREQVSLNIDAILNQKGGLNALVLTQLDFTQYLSQKCGRKSGVVDKKTALKFNHTHKLAQTLTLCVDWLEKDRQYGLSCFVLTHLLISQRYQSADEALGQGECSGVAGQQFFTQGESQSKNLREATQRGKWWHRLCIDLRHLKMKKESCEIARYALLSDEANCKVGVKIALLKHYESSRRMLTKAKKGRHEDVLDKMLTQISSAVAKPAKKEKGSLLEETFGGYEEEVTYNKEYFRELRLSCPNVSAEFQEAEKAKAIEASLEDRWKSRTVQFTNDAAVLNQQFNPDLGMARPMYLDPTTGDVYDVENLALKHYSKNEGLNGMHCENSLGQTMFGLLMWAIIFDDSVPYAFQSPFQSRPLDFGTAHFYANRKAKADPRLAEIASSPSIGKEIQESWERNFNKFNGFVNWSSVRLNCRRLTEIGTIIGGKRMAAILQNYTEDYKFWNHGMADLILWDPESKRVKFSEVKSENDRLSDVQRAWLKSMSNSEIECEVCLVNWKGGEQVLVFPFTDNK